MSDLMSTVKILAGSTVEIAAASVGDQHLVASVRLAEDNNAAETLNGVEVNDIKAEAPEEAGDRSGIDSSDLKTEGEEQEEMSSTIHAVEDTGEVVDDHVKSEGDSFFVAEDYVENHALSEEASGTDMKNIMELEESTSAVVMLTEDESISGAAEVKSETFEAEGQKMEEALCHDPACRESEHADLTAPPVDLEETLQATTEEAEAVVIETTLDAVEEAKPAKASEDAVENEKVTMTMAQA